MPFKQKMIQINNCNTLQISTKTFHIELSFYDNYMFTKWVVANFLDKEFRNRLNSLLFDKFAVYDEKLG